MKSKNYSQFYHTEIRRHGENKDVIPNFTFVSSVSLRLRVIATR